MKKIFLHILIIAIISSCSLFETRSPEPPYDGGSSVFTPPTSPSIVIDNIIETINTGNIDNYYTCFSSSYSFIPTNESTVQYPNIFDNWKAEDEKQFLLSIYTALGKNNPLKFQLDNKEFANINADSAMLISEYSISFDIPNATYPTQYEGKAYISVAKMGNGLWAVSKWQDFSKSDANYASLSNLKAIFK